MLIKVPKSWEIPERELTPESGFFDRRSLLKMTGFAGLGVLNSSRLLTAGTEDLYPAKHNPKYKLDRPLSHPKIVTGFNNFYEFSTDKEQVKEMVHRFKIEPWTLKVKGLVNNPGKYDIEHLIRRFPLEERFYRMRCVEAWSVAVPWTGFPLSSFIKFLDPKPEANYVRMTTVQRFAEMPGITSQSFYPWPYHEALRMDEAMNEMTMLVTGVYGKPLPKQNGAPIRLVTPWKYGLKSIKSIIEIRYTKKRPSTFWTIAVGDEYGWFSNVNPARPHVRWSQATERFLGPRGEEKLRTLPYNGYQKFVASMYTGKEY